MATFSMRALMFNKKAKKDSSQVLSSLQIKPGDIIADIGSGGGYFVFEFAKKVGEDGQVFAIDIDKNLLDYIDARIKSRQVQNISTLLSDENGFALPQGNCDLMFMRNVFHHLSEPVSYLRNITANLKPEGRIVVIEWLPASTQTEHSTPESEIHKTMQAAGFKHLESFDFLKKQSFNIFK